MKRMAFFNNKGGVGKTTLVYHIAHMLADKGLRVLLVDLDPQSNLTTMCLSEERLEELWPENGERTQTILGALPLWRSVGDIQEPHLEHLRDGLALLPGDLDLAPFEGLISQAWASTSVRNERAFQVLTALHRVIKMAADNHRADFVLVDLAPTLGPLNRLALIDVDFIITPLAPDRFSMQSLRILGPSLEKLRHDWQIRVDHHLDTQLARPSGRMQPLGYIITQIMTILSKINRTYANLMVQIPIEYHRAVLLDDTTPSSAEEDPWYLGIMRHYHSLVAFAQDAKKPMFHLRPADGAIGAHMDAVRRCREDFDHLTSAILARANALSQTSS